MFEAKTDALAKDFSRQSGETAKDNMITDRILLLRDVKGGAFKKSLRNVKDAVFENVQSLAF